jgi:ATP-dependent helicase HrpB
MTDTGRNLRSLPLPPRLAAMLIEAAKIGAERDAADIAAVLVERGLGGNDTSLDHRLEAFRRDRSRRATEMRRLADNWAKTARSAVPQLSRRNSSEAGDASPTAAALLALAYPERIAKARGPRGQYLLANGRGANLDTTDALSRAPFLVIAEMQGTAAATRIMLAAETSEAEVAFIASGRIESRDELTFDREAGAVRARHIRKLGAIELASEPRAAPSGPAVEAALVAGIAKLGAARLPWSKAQHQLRERVAFLRAAGGSDWPDLSDDALTTTLTDWLSPYLPGKTRLADITADDLGQALEALIPWNMKRRLEDDAPTHFEAPTGNRHAIDYEGAGAPALHIRVQELFGLKEHPAIAGGRLPLTLHLLSPAHRPIQITRDLPGFWSGSWAAVKSEMKGRYPRHPWPDDPAGAAPTARAKPRGT